MDRSDVEIHVVAPYGLTGTRCVQGTAGSEDGCTVLRSGATMQSPGRVALFAIALTLVAAVVALRPLRLVVRDRFVEEGATERTAGPGAWTWTGWSDRSPRRPCPRRT
jgi:hypothetical protein